MHIQLNPEQRKSKLNHYAIGDIHKARTTMIKYYPRTKLAGSGRSLNSGRSLISQILQSTKKIPSINGKELSFQFGSPPKDSRAVKSKLTLAPIRNQCSKQSQGQIIHYYKANSIRNQNNQTKHNIMSMQARINKIRRESERNRRKVMQSNIQMDKLLQAKHNSLEKQKKKSDYLNKIMEDSLNRTQSIRLTRKKSKQALELSKSRLRQQKQLQAISKRQIRLRLQQQIKIQKEKNIQSNQMKAYQTKMYQIEQTKIKQLSIQHSKNRARSNHNEKVGKYLKQKQKLQRKAKSLRKAEIRLMTQYMKSTHNLMETQAKMEMIRTSSKNKSFYQ